MTFFIKFLFVKSLYYLCGRNQFLLRQVEPPSPIFKDQKIMTDQTSDDPLSSSIYMIMGNASGEGKEAVSVCAWSAHTGLSYIGTASPVLS